MTDLPFADPVPLHEAGWIDAYEAADSTAATTEPLTLEDIERLTSHLESSDASDAVASTSHLEAS